MKNYKKIGENSSFVKYQITDKDYIINCKINKLEASCESTIRKHTDKSIVNKKDFSSMYVFIRYSEQKAKRVIHDIDIDKIDLELKEIYSDMKKEYKKHSDYISKYYQIVDKFQSDINELNKTI